MSIMQYCIDNMSGVKELTALRALRPPLNKSVLVKKPAYLSGEGQPTVFGRHETFSYEKERIEQIVPKVRELIKKDKPSAQIIEMTGTTSHYNQNVVRTLQMCGDIALIEDGKFSKTFDFKFEKSASPNLFTELWSNKSSNKGLHKLGWVMTTYTDYILYSFEEYNRIGVISLDGLRQWLRVRTKCEATIEESPVIKKYRMVDQGKHKQANRTVGILVPFSDLPESVLIGCLVFEENECYYAKGEHFSKGLPSVFAGDVTHPAIPAHERIENLI